MDMVMVIVATALCSINITVDQAVEAVACIIGMRVVMLIGVVLVAHVGIKF